MPTSLIIIYVERKGMVGDLGVWTPWEAHQPGARDDLTGPLPFGTRGKQWMARRGRLLMTWKENVANSTIDEDNDVAGRCYDGKPWSWDAEMIEDVAKASVNKHEGQMELVKHKVKSFN